MPDVYFQLCEASNNYYKNVPAIIKNNMKKFGEKTGRFVYYIIILLFIV